MVYHLVSIAAHTVASQSNMSIYDVYDHNTPISVSAMFVNITTYRVLFQSWIRDIV